MTSRMILCCVVLGALVPSRSVIAHPQDNDPPPAGAATKPPPADPMADEEGFGDLDDFGELSLEELMQIEVTSVAGYAQPLHTTPSAIHVITNEDLKRTGHRNIAEALRMVPGLSVARVTSSRWAVSSRGFNSLFADKMLVLVDGRTVYDPIFSGVFWEIEDLVMEDIDRIEVIRGPGATLWGANAVNGVINVTTRSAHETQGLYVTGGAGNEYQGFGAFRYGDTFGENGAYRVWGKYHNSDATEDTAGAGRPDDWSFFRGGARFDWEAGEDIRFTLQGDVYNTPTLGDAILVPVPGHLTFDPRRGDSMRRGGNILFRMTQDQGPDESWTFQAYYNRFDAENFSLASLTRDTFDLDFRRYEPIGDRHQLVWGLGFQYSNSNLGSQPTLTWNDDSRELYVFSAFIQDTWEIVPEKLKLMYGSKFSHNDFTGFEFQPSARLSWTPDKRRTFWAAASRSVRTPSQAEDDVNITTAFVDTGLISGGPPSGVFIPLVLSGDRNVDSEELFAFELGYRQQISDTVTIDIAAFYHDYDHLIMAPTPPASFDNNATAETYGVEISTSATLADNWRVNAGYAFFKANIHAEAGVGELIDEGASPEQQFHIRSYLDLTEDLQFNAAAYYVDNIRSHRVPAYWRVDLGLTWKIDANTELSIWGQNLLDPSHQEFDESLFLDMPSEIERSVYAQLTVRF